MRHAADADISFYMHPTGAVCLPPRPHFRRPFSTVKKVHAVDSAPVICYNNGMLPFEAKTVAFGVAANSSRETPAPAKNAVSAAMSYLCGKTDKAAFLRKCDKFPLYARLVLLAEQPATDFSVDALCAVHRTIFSPRAKCGELRTADLEITGGSCTPPHLLRGSLKNVLAKLEKLQGAPAVGKADFAASLCCYVRELIILSPFAYGNDVVRRAFVQQFCYVRGYLLNYAAVGKKELSAAETEAFASDDPQPLFTLLVKCLNYRQEEQPRRRRAAPLPPPVRREQKSLSAQPQPERPPASERPALERAATASTASDTLRELKEIQRTLSQLSTRVNELIKTVEKTTES